jgi:hypothetical protein
VLEGGEATIENRCITIRDPSHGECMGKGECVGRTGSSASYSPWCKHSQDPGTPLTPPRPPPPERCVWCVVLWVSLDRQIGNLDCQ